MKKVIGSILFLVLAIVIYYFSAKNISAPTNLSGSWYWESGEKGPIYYERGLANPKHSFVPELTFSLNLNLDKDGEVSGNHEFILEGGYKVDSGLDMGEIKNSLANLKFSTSFGDPDSDIEIYDGVAEVDYDPSSDTLAWKKIKSPQLVDAPDYFPVEVILHRAKNAR